MRKVQVAVFIGLGLLMFAWIKIHDPDKSTRLTPSASSSASASASASAATSAAPATSAAATSAASGEPAAPDDSGSLDSDDPPEAGAGGHPEAPSLEDAPKSVRFAVILVKYAGAQLAKEDERSKEEAAKLAEALATEAETDFKAALKKGDKGSNANAGRMFRGLLEADAEYALFSLDKGGVSKPVDTPRGFWILKRLE